MTATLIASTVVIALVGLGFAAWNLVQSHKEAHRQKTRSSED